MLDNKIISRFVALITNLTKSKQAEAMETTSVFEKISAIKAFRSKNYRLFYLGQSVSVLGNFLQSVATGWLIYRLTDSPFFLGLSNFASNVPILFLAPFAGVIADRVPRQKIIRITQISFMIVCFFLAATVLLNLIKPWHILVINLLFGIITAFDMPGRQTFLYDVLDYKEDLTNAVALNAIMFNGSRMIGPAIAGFLIAKYGEGLCFLINAFSFTAIVFTLFLIKTPPINLTNSEESVIKNLKEGISYVRNTKSIKTLLFFIFLTSTCTAPVMTLMPVFAKDIFKSGPETMGMFMGCVGIGAIISGVFLAVRKKVFGLNKVMTLASIFFGISIMIFAWSRNIALSQLMAVFAGSCMIIMFSGCNTLTQTIVEPDKRGRIMSLYTTAFVGAVPVGSLISGSLAAEIGVSYTCQLSGILCMFCALLLYLNRKSIAKDLKEASERNKMPQ